MERPGHHGPSHVALTVQDLDASVAWYGRVLGLAPLFAFATDDFDRRLLVDSTGLVVALTRHHATGSGDAFDPTRVGLDHLSLRVDSVEALAAWAAWLDACDVANGGVQRDESLGSAVVAFTDPDGIQLELYHQASAPRS